MSALNLNSVSIAIVTDKPESSNFSFNIEDSDFTNNQLLLNSLIGTLVKYDTAGRISGYLAKEWHVSADNRQWTFLLNENLVCENGEKINASSFKVSLLKNLASFSKRGSALSFDYLVGWTDFISQNKAELDGIQVIDLNTIKFTFTRNPEDLLELLRMPYFGYWCNPSEKQIVSSGPYKLESFEGSLVKMSVRKDWFSVTPKSPQSLTFQYISQAHEGLLNFDIVKIPYNLDSSPYLNSNFFLVKSPPTRFEGIVLSPYKKNIFDNIKNRRILQSRISTLADEFQIESNFYPSATAHQRVDITNENFDLSNHSSVLTIALERNNYEEKEIYRFKQLFSKLLAPEGLEFKLVERYKDSKLFFKQTDSNSFFDIRIASVDIGASIQRFGIKMMFCSKLGISFPDPSVRICKLCEEQDLKEDFSTRFSQYLYEDAAVIPYARFSEQWLVSKRIFPSSFPSVVTFPRFENVSFQ